MLLCKEKFLWIIWHGVDKNLQGQIISLMFSRQLSCSVYVKCFSVLSRIGTDHSYCDSLGVDNWR